MAVQVLSSTSNNLPEKYIHKERTSSPCDMFPVLEVPKVDVSLLLSESPEGAAELKKLRLALSSCGYIQAVNHGVDLLDEMYDVTRRFFSLPLEEKQKYSRADDDTDGFGNDQILTEDQSLDWNDRLYLNLYPKDKRRLKVWPENPQDFRKILLDYTTKLDMLNGLILKAMAKSLDLEQNCFVKQYGERPNVHARFNFYPPCPRPDLTLGSKPHADASALTFLLQDNEVEGLQVLKDDQWFRIPVIRHALLVNTGDQAEIMTNGVFKSPIHRVVTNTEKKRITLAIFFTPDKGNLIEPAEGLIDENRPRLYKQVVDYGGAFFQEYHKGKRVIDALKI